MVTEWVLTLTSGFIAWAFGLLSLPEVPVWLEDSDTWFSTIKEFMADTEVWLPWSLALAVIGISLTVLAAAYAIKIGRIVLSFLTLGGGSAS